MTETDDFTIFDGSHAGERKCGDCQLCCKLLAVKSLRKPSWSKCQHQRVGKGCRVYDTPQMPQECSFWSCRWLTKQDTISLSRPDRSHYVIDIMPDLISTDGREIMVIQVWQDPGFPHAHRDPALRAYILRRAEQDGIPTLVRTGDGRAILIAAPCLTADGEWMEKAAVLNVLGSGNRMIDALMNGRAAGRVVTA